MYPGVALRNRQTGTVNVEIFVDSEGKVTEARVQKSSGYPWADGVIMAAYDANFDQDHKKTAQGGL